MIETERLRLSPLSRAQAEHIIAGERTGQPWAVGYPRSDDRDVARMFLTAPPAEDGFGPLQIVDRRTALVIGGIGFFGPPDALGLVELGYGVAPEVEGRGYATEALRALLAWAYRTGRVTRAIADTTHDNVGSQRVMEKAGMRHTGADKHRRYYQWRAARTDDAGLLAR